MCGGEVRALRRQTETGMAAASMKFGFSARLVAVGPVFRAAN